MYAHNVISIQQWKKEYFRPLLRTLREEDIQELSTIGIEVGYSWQQMFARTIALSSYRMAILHNGSCCGVFGVRTYATSYASIWLLCTQALQQYPRAILILAKAHIQQLLKQYHVLINCVSEYSLPFVRPFLQYCGFTLHETPLFVGRERMHVFYITL